MVAFHHLALTLLPFLAPGALATSSGRRDDAPALNCKEILKLSTKEEYDLSSLAGVHTVMRTRDIPPTKMEDRVRFDLCADLSPAEGVNSEDQCPSGTRACFTKTNKKGSDGDRVIAAIPLAQSSNLTPLYTPISSPKGLNLVLHGPSYPPSGSDSRPQSFNITLVCSDSTTDLELRAYDGAQAEISWKTPAGCIHPAGAPPSNPDDGKYDDGKHGSDVEERVGSGIGWFFLVLILGLLAYFGLGAYYNYANYGATGVDLIPHRDFWREVPYMIKDVVSHLCSSVRTRQSTNRGGYMSV